jgi:hypothetical protein
MSATRLAILEKEIADENKLAELMAPVYERLKLPHEIGRRQLTVNGWLVVEKFMSDDTSRVFIEGLRVNMSYFDAIRSRGAK